MMNPQGYIINIGLSIIVGLVFAGVQSDDVIRNDLPWWGFAGALLLQEALLVQWLSRDKNTARKQDRWPAGKEQGALEVSLCPSSRPCALVFSC